MRILGSDGGGSWRRPVEGMCRFAVLALLAWSLARALGKQPRGTTEVAVAAEVTAALPRWSTAGAPSAVHLGFEGPPPRYVRDWLAALQGTGTAVTWHGSGLVPTAAVIEPIADPLRGADFLLAAPEGAPIALRDGLGTFDSIQGGRYGSRTHLARPPGTVEAAIGAVVTRAPLQDSLILGRLLILSQAGWEGKFAAAALEERGWKVDALLAVSPKGQGDVRQGKIGAIDTATYAAVLAIDTVAARYAGQVVRYVRSGGGLVVWPDAASIPAFAPLLPGQTARSDAPDAESDTVAAAPEVALPDSAPRQALRLAALTNVHADGVVLERQPSGIALAARRVGAGRVLQTGYLDSWRWRMGGRGDDAPTAHREWLARLVATAAYAGRHPVPGDAGDVAPLATLVDRLGAPTPAVPAEDKPETIEPWIFGLLFALLLAEWGGRRLRGAA